MNNILCTVSGGKTSAFMAVYLRERFPDANILFAFANTGKELPQTYDFLLNLENHFGLDIVWLEAEISAEKGVGTSYRVVSPGEHSINGEPFEAAIRKYGLPSKMWRHCTRELKEKPVHKFAKEHFPDGYQTALGIRADERHRATAKEGIFYPLVEINVTERFIDDWWDKQPFNLELQKSQGNCDFCFLKSKRKRINLLKSGLDVSWWAKMEEDYADEKRPMFDVRNDITVADLVELSKVENLQMGLDFDVGFNCFCGN